MRLSTPLALAITLSLVACGNESEPEPPTNTPGQEIPEAPADVVEAPPETAVPGAPADPARPGDPDAGETAADAAAAEGRQLFTVQVAAFTNRESAEMWTDRLSGQGLPVWTSVTEQAGRTFYRVRMGASPTVAEARRLGESLTERYQWPVWVAPMTAEDRPPRDAVEATRRVVGTG